MTPEPRKENEEIADRVITCLCNPSHFGSCSNTAMPCGHCTDKRRKVIEALDAKDAEKAVVQEELKTERRHWIEDDRDLNELIAKNEALTSKLKIAEKALVKLGRFKLGSFGDMFLNDIIDSALKSIRGDEGVK